MDEIAPRDLKAKLDAGERVLLLDVREVEENERVRIDAPGASLIPMGQLEDREADLVDYFADDSAAKVVYCRSGRRSAIAIEWLELQGITGLKNLRGGINAYAEEADPSLEPY